MEGGGAVVGEEHRYRKEEREEEEEGGIGRMDKIKGGLDEKKRCKQMGEK